MLLSAILLIAILAIAAVIVPVCRRGGRIMAKPGLQNGAVSRQAGPGVLTIGNAQHIGKREDQQDSFGISDIGNPQLTRDKGMLAVVADGMGGLANGKISSNTVVSSMLERFVEQTGTLTIPEQLLSMVNWANDRVYESANQGSGARSGSTVAAVIIKNGSLYWISAGDSRIYLYRNGKLAQATQDHVYGNELFADALQGRITLEEAKMHREKKSLISYIGTAKVEHVDRNAASFRLYPGDRILLCSDGIYGALAESEIAGALDLEPHLAAEELVVRVNGKQLPGQDNMTAVVIGL
jgi:protein phosphatase